MTRTGIFFVVGSGLKLMVQCLQQLEEEDCGVRKQHVLCNIRGGGVFYLHSFKFTDILVLILM